MKVKTIVDGKEVKNAELAMPAQMTGLLVLDSITLELTNAHVVFDKDSIWIGDIKISSFEKATFYFQSFQDVYSVYKPNRLRKGYH